MCDSGSSFFSLAGVGKRLQDQVSLAERKWQPPGNRAALVIYQWPEAEFFNTNAAFSKTKLIDDMSMLPTSSSNHK